MRGIITRSIGGLYTAESSDGVYECRARGIFRKQGISPAVGDNIEFENGIINEIYDRKNSLIRPPLANLDYLVFVVSVSQPAPNYLLLDKFIAVAEYQHIEPVIAVTKIDIESCEDIISIYSKVGINVIAVDYSREEPVEELKGLLHNKISAFTGNSGAGKSTLLNAICPGLDIPTGEISKKLGRGRHTTRHAQLYKLPWGGYIADTPGFSTFETDKYSIIRKEELSGCFREFGKFEGKCRFRDCSHTKEKGCSVIEAVENGDISQSRHESYCAMYEDAKKIREWEL